ncbi:MAG TPA: tRNA lysidine(34) synthetase TilS, partial [Lacibacter sp.]|nr:tRNA lysidine(34) synthetase TilS [Lacibacter sp.]
WFIISPVQSVESATIIIEEKDAEVLFEEGRLSFRKTDASKVDLASPNNIALLDAKEISFPLLLRKWKTGDYFYPLGMKKKKKVARFLIDAKLSKTQKENVWVLESNKRIIWVVNHRIDDRFKLTPATKDVLQFWLK